MCQKGLSKGKVLIFLRHFISLNLKILIKLKNLDILPKRSGECNDLLLAAIIVCSIAIISICWGKYF